MVNLTYGDLVNSGKYKRVKEVKHADILWFIRDNLKPVNGPMIFFYVFNLLLFLSFLFQIYQSWLSGVGSFWSKTGFFFLGILLFLIVIIPMHELIHLLTYKILGAPKTSISAQWDKLLFYAAADKFVMDFREFLTLALLPFLIINLGLIIALFFISDSVQFGFWAALLFHSTGCIGDFVLIGFLSSGKRKGWLNVDDMDKGSTEFYCPVLNTLENVIT